MSPNDLLSLHQVKTLEYLLAVSYLLLFFPFWRFVVGPARAAGAVSRVPAGTAADWFAVPQGLRFHPGHAWARRDAGDLVTVGMDDFARKLVGPLDALELPRIGSTVRQGEGSLRLLAGDKGVAMLSPVDGTVVAVNQDVLQRPDTVGDDPYGKGWLFKVKPASWRANSRQLLGGVLARRWMEGVAELLRGESSGTLGAVLQDGGQPVDGIARELRGDRWDEFARTYLLS